jgi:hypothetical protein
MATRQDLEEQVAQLRGIAESTDARLANISETLQVIHVDIRTGFQSNQETLQSIHADIRTGFQSILEVLQEINHKLSR